MVLPTLYWSNLSLSFGRVLNPGAKFNVLVTAYFSGAKYGTLTNFVTSKGYNLRRESMTSSSSTNVLALNQNIAVVKTSNITSGSPGAPVNFTLDIHNSGGLTLEHVFVSDLLPSGMATSLPRPEVPTAVLMFTGLISVKLLLTHTSSCG